MINGGGGQHDAGTAVIRAWAAQDSYSRCWDERDVSLLKHGVEEIIFKGMHGVQMKNINMRLGAKCDGQPLA